MHARTLAPLALALVACGNTPRPPASSVATDAAVEASVDAVTEASVDAVSNDAVSNDAVSNDAPTVTDGAASDGATSGCPTACVAYASTSSVTASDSRLDELSGIVEGRAHPGLFYVHNDSGDRARFFAVNVSGGVVGEYRLAGVTAIDIEDIAAAPCSEGRCLYLGDVGDNDRVRDGYVIYRVSEPAPAADVSEVTATALPFRYADGAHNAETLVADPATHDLYVVTKEETGASGVYRYFAAMQTGAMAVLPRVASLELPVSGAQLVTGGDLHPCGGRLLIRTYVKLFEYERPAGAPFERVFEVTPREVAFRPERQGEAVGWCADGNGYVTVSEGGSPVLNLFACSGM